MRSWHRCLINLAGFATTITACAFWAFGFFIMTFYKGHGVIFYEFNPFISVGEMTVTTFGTMWLLYHFFRWVNQETI